MFGEFREVYASSSQSACPSSSDYSSSFRNNAPLEGSPPSTRRSSFDSAKLEDMPFSTTTTPERYIALNSMSSMSSMTHEIHPGFPDHNMFFPNAKMMRGQKMAGFNAFPTYSNEAFEPFESSDGLPVQTPALEMDLCSPVSMDFVVPSQITFIDDFDMNCPMPTLQFQSPASDYNWDFSLHCSPTENMAFSMQYDDCTSTSTTPSLASTTPCRISKLRQPIFDPASTSAALQRVQSGPQAVRRKRVKRELSSQLMFSSNIHIQQAATKPCLWKGCGKRFKRQEHLKRHERIHTFVPEDDSFPCQFCGHPFNRSDNLKSHMKLHTDPHKSQTRTKFHPEAQAIYDQMSRKKKRKSNEGVKLEETSLRSCALAYRGPRQRADSTGVKLRRSRL